jgi:hypothetical protein
MSEALEHLLDYPFCGSPAELQEWEERDATRWASLVKCTSCHAEVPKGYADNRLGCYDAVNNLHKQRAIAGWNKRAHSKVTEESGIDECIDALVGARTLVEKFHARNQLDLAISRLAGGVK